jgi:hypothetical protein
MRVLVGNPSKRKTARAAPNSTARAAGSAMEKYLIAFRLSGDHDDAWREVTAADRETAQYVYDGLLPLPDLHSIELYEWRPAADGALGLYAPGSYVVLLSKP